MKAIERLKQYIEFKGFTNSHFEKKNELSNGYIATQSKRNADLGEGVLIKILNNCLDLNPLWLLTGKGSMLKSEVNKGLNQNIKGDSNIQSGNSTYVANETSAIQECKKKMQRLENEIKEYKIKLDAKENQVSQLINTVTALSQSKQTK